ncbi:MAG TPA: TFIIB-type zinc ribbon-containing protein [Nitrososphaeraceae archaeon]|nr:TFIIB-type zinc ribbon-containing protein [Nitrososphaeraceae archaeon]
MQQESAKMNIDNEVCSLCESQALVFDAETSETVCSSCGMVVHDNTESMGPEWRVYSGGDVESKSRTGMPTSLAFHDMGLSTFISYSNVDANGAAISPEQMSKVQRMRRWNKISSNNRSYHRNLKNAFAILSTIKDKLSLNDALIEKSAYNYRKALDRRIIKGRSIRALVVASVYAACRELNVPRTLDEIAQTANTDSIFAGKCYRLLVRFLKLHLPVLDSNVYLAKIASKANVSEKTYRRALEMLTAIKENPVSHGKDPNALAVAVLYAACLKENEKVSQAQIAVAGDTSIVTLRKRYQDVKSIFP